MRDGRVDVFDSGGGVQNTVTIDTDRHGKSLAECAESTFSKAALCPSASPRHLYSQSAESVIVGYTL